MLSFQYGNGFRFPFRPQYFFGMLRWAAWFIISMTLWFYRSTSSSYTLWSSRCALHSPWYLFQSALSSRHFKTVSPSVYNWSSISVITGRGTETIVLFSLCHTHFETRLLDTMFKSMWVIWPRLFWNVTCPVFGTTKLFCVTSVSTARPLAFSDAEFHSLFLAFRSPTMIVFGRVNLVWYIATSISGVGGTKTLLIVSFPFAVDTSTTRHSVFCGLGNCMYFEPTLRSISKPPFVESRSVRMTSYPGTENLFPVSEIFPLYIWYHMHCLPRAVRTSLACKGVRSRSNKIVSSPLFARAKAFSILWC